MNLALKDIAAGVLGRLQASPSQPIADGPVRLAVSDLAALSLIPFYCDPFVQWAVVARRPDGKPPDAKAARKIKGIAVAVVDGDLQVGVPGDGIDPALVFLQPLAAALSTLPAGSRLELLAANLGTVHRDWQVKAEGVSTAGDQRYAGRVEQGGRWVLTESYPAATSQALRDALALLALVQSRGPWQARDETEAAAIIDEAFDSAAFNVGLGPFRRKIRVHGRQIVLSDLDAKHVGMGLMFFRRRFAGGPWDVEAGRRLDAEARARQPRHPDVKREVMAEVLGGARQ